MKVLLQKSKSKLAFSHLVTILKIAVCSHKEIVMLLNNPMTEWDTFLSLPIVDYLWVTRKKTQESYCCRAQKD